MKFPGVSTATDLKVWHQGHTGCAWNSREREAGPDCYLGMDTPDFNTPDGLLEFAARVAKGANAKRIDVIGFMKVYLEQLGAQARPIIDLGDREAALNEREKKLDVVAAETQARKQEVLQREAAVLELLDLAEKRTAEVTEQLLTSPSGRLLKAAQDVAHVNNVNVQVSPTKSIFLVPNVQGHYTPVEAIALAADILRKAASVS